MRRNKQSYKWQQSDGAWRRFSNVTTYQGVINKIKGFEPGFAEQIGWKDDDGEFVLIANDDDLREAIELADGNTIKLISKDVDSGGSSASGSSHSTVVHRDVFCDSCAPADVSPIEGTRYKCRVCPDYDLCQTCKSQGKHKQHDFIKIDKPGDYRPKSSQSGSSKSKASNTSTTSGPSSSVVHWDFACDGCDDVPIVGVRYKCLVCPEFDLCETCKVQGKHKQHSFSEIHKSVAQDSAKSHHDMSVVHRGVRCDGCDQLSLIGPRYKCLDCANFDLCHSCMQQGKHAQHDFDCIAQPIARASTASARSRPMSTPVGGTVVINRLYIASDIQSRFATTHILSEIVNRGQQAAEAKFTAQLPQEAFITSFKMVINGETVDGKIKKKQEAAAIYRQAKRTGQTSALTEKVIEREQNLFSTSVNIEQYGKIYFMLTYVEMLERQHGLYKHTINVHPNQQVYNIQVQVRIAERQPILNVHVPKFGPKIGQMTNADLMQISAEPKAIVNNQNSNNDYYLCDVHFKRDQAASKTSGQLVVLYDVQRGHDGGQIETYDGFFVHFIAPSKLPTVDKSVCFVIDRSGSMMGRKLEQTKHAMKVVLQSLRPTDRFTIISFDDEIDVSRTAPATQHNIESALEFVNKLSARGSTDLHGAIQSGLKVLKAETNDDTVKMMIFLTDGEPTWGVCDRYAIVNNISNANRDKHSIHGISFGEAADHKLVQRIAASSYGVAKKVYEDSDADLQLKGFFAEISTPVLRDVSVRYMSGNVELTSLVKSNDFNTLFEGGEATVLGRLLGAKKQVESKLIGKNARRYLELTSVPYHFVPRRGRTLISPWSELPMIVRIGWPDAFQKQILEPTTIGGFIERMWAYKTVQRLLADSKLQWSEKDKREKLEKALDLSLKYGFVTEQTSMVIVPPRQSTSIELHCQSYQVIHAPLSAGYQMMATPISGVSLRGGGSAQPAVCFGRISPPGPGDQFISEYGYSGQKRRTTTPKMISISRRSRSTPPTRTYAAAAYVEDEDSTDEEDGGDTAEEQTKQKAAGILTSTDRSVLIILATNNAHLSDAIDKMLQILKDCSSSATLVTVVFHLGDNHFGRWFNSNLASTVITKVNKNPIKSYNAKWQNSEANLKEISDDVLMSTTSQKLIVISDSQSSIGPLVGLLKYMRTSVGVVPVFVCCNGKFTQRKHTTLEDITAGQQGHIIEE